ncbi:hypothetical protein D3C78_1714370 [compost metagenome]
MRLHIANQFILTDFRQRDGEAMRVPIYQDSIAIDPAALFVVNVIIKHKHVALLDQAEVPDIGECIRLHY